MRRPSKKRNGAPGQGAAKNNRSTTTKKFDSKGSASRRGGLHDGDHLVPKYPFIVPTRIGEKTTDTYTEAAWLTNRTTIDVATRSLVVPETVFIEAVANHPDERPPQAEWKIVRAGDGREAYVFPCRGSTLRKIGLPW